MNSVLQEIDYLAKYTGLHPGQFRHIYWGGRETVSSMDGTCVIGWSPPINSQWIVTQLRGVGYTAAGVAVDVSSDLQITIAGSGVTANHTLTPEFRPILLQFTGGNLINFNLRVARSGQNPSQFSIHTGGYLVQDTLTTIEAVATQIIQTQAVYPLPPFST